MQNFKLSATMANMVNLDQIVELYCIAIKTFKTCRTKYDLSVPIIRYEDLLEDLASETTTLLSLSSINF